MSEREQRVVLLRTAIDGYLGGELALDNLVSEMKRYEDELRAESMSVDTYKNQYAWACREIHRVEQKLKHVERERDALVRALERLAFPEITPKSVEASALQAEVEAIARDALNEIVDRTIENVKREIGENPRYGPGNPDWEHDREREDRA